MQTTKEILAWLKRLQQEAEQLPRTDDSNSIEIPGSYYDGAATGIYLFRGQTGWHITDDFNLEGNCWPASDENLIIAIEGGF